MKILYSKATAPAPSDAVSSSEIQELKAEVARLRVALDAMQKAPCVPTPTPAPVQAPMKIIEIMEPQSPSEPEPKPKPELTLEPLVNETVEPAAVVEPVHKRSPKPLSKTVLFDPLWSHLKKS
jgi:hypothetical protein